MEVKKKRKNSILFEIFDALFIMIICFTTLLTAMLLKGNTIGVSKYTIHITTLSITLLGLGVYLSFVLNKSEKELKLMIGQLYNGSELQ